MKEIYYTYNNEAIGSCTILAVLSRTKSLDISTACLVLPFLLDDKTVNYFANIEGEALELDKIIKDKPRLFNSFNSRFQALLPVTINSIVLLHKAKNLEISSTISFSETSPTPGEDLGDRFNKIRNAIPAFIKLLEGTPPERFYKLLKIQL